MNQYLKVRSDALDLDLGSEHMSNLGGEAVVIYCGEARYLGLGVLNTVMGFEFGMTNGAALHLKRQLTSGNDQPYDYLAIAQGEGFVQVTPTDQTSGEISRTLEALTSVVQLHEGHDMRTMMQYVTGMARLLVGGVLNLDIIEPSSYMMEDAHENIRIAYSRFSKALQEGYYELTWTDHARKGEWVSKVETYGPVFGMRQPTWFIADSHEELAAICRIDSKLPVLYRGQYDEEAAKLLGGRTRITDPALTTVAQLMQAYKAEYQG
jgi:hypothetical protein